MAEEPGKEETKKSGGSSMMPLVIVAVVAGLVAGVLGAVGSRMFGGGGGAKEHASAAAEEKDKGPSVTAVVPFEAFVVNLADPSGNKYLRVELNAVVNDAKVVEQLKTDQLVKTRVRDRILTVLSAKSYQDIGTPAGKESLRKELTKEVNSVLSHDAVQEMLFANFAVQ